MLREGWFQQNNPSTVTFVRDITLGRTFKSDKQNVKYPFPVFSKPFNKSLIAAFWFLILSIFFSIFGWPQSFPINVICFYNTHHALVVLVNGTFDILNILLSKSWNIWYCLWLIHWMLYTVYMGPMRKNGSWDGTQLPSQQKTWFLSQSCSFTSSLPPNIHPGRGLNILFSSCSESFVTFYGSSGHLLELTKAHRQQWDGAGSISLSVPARATLPLVGNTSYSTLR